MPDTTVQAAAPQPTARADAWSIRATARWAGVFYLVLSATSIFGYLYVPGRFFVAGDAGATAAKILADLPLYRLALLSALIGQVFFLFTAVALYLLFRQVGRAAALGLLVLVCVGVAVQIGELVSRVGPLVLLGGDAYLDAFTKPQLAALAYAFIAIGARLGDLITLFWGLWLFPFGYLTIRSGFFPRFLGYLLYVSGFAYVVTSVVGVGFPAQTALATRLLTPLYFPELVMVLWLPIVGARVPTEH